MTFKNAIIISVLIHLMVIFSMKSYGLVVPEVDRRYSIVVDYMKIEAPKDAKITPAIDETSKTELLQKVENLPASANAAEVKSNKDEAATRELAVRQARARSTKDYINYNQLIREKIRQRVKDKYRSYYDEGDVCLVFTLSSNGSIVSVAADPAVSTSDRVLVDTAVQSLREAAPFASFPKALQVPQMSFTVIISFKKR